MKILSYLITNFIFRPAFSMRESIEECTGEKGMAYEGNLSSFD